MSGEKKKNLTFEFINDITYNKKGMLLGDEDDDARLKDYNNWLTCHHLSYFPDTAIIANFLNVNHHIDKDVHYKFLLNAVRKKKRFTKWAKKAKTAEQVEIIKEYYGYNYRVAESVADLITDEQLKVLQSRLDKGGKR